MLKPSLEIISESFHLYLRNFRKYVPYILMMFLPFVVLAVLGIAFSYLEVFLESSWLLGVVANILIILVFIIQGIITYWWGPIALTRALHADIVGQVLEWKENVRTSKRLIIPLFLTSALFGLIMCGLLLIPILALILLTVWPNLLTSLVAAPLILVPIIFIAIFSVWYVLYFFPVVLDGTKYLSALNFSKSLVRGQGWKIAWRFIMFGLVFGIITIIPLLVMSYLVTAIPIPSFLQLTFQSLLQRLVVILLAPLTTSAPLILYLNAKQLAVTDQGPSTPSVSTQ